MNKKTITLAAIAIALTAGTYAEAPWHKFAGGLVEGTTKSCAKSIEWTSPKSSTKRCKLSQADLGSTTVVVSSCSFKRKGKQWRKNRTLTYSSNTNARLTIVEHRANDPRGVTKECVYEGVVGHKE